MEILKYDEFVKESMLPVTKNVTEYISLDSIIADVKYDGTLWNDFERGDRGSFEDYKALPENKGTSLDTELQFNFEHVDADGEYVDDICEIKALVKVRFTDMAAGDFDIEVAYCNGADKLLEFVKGNNYENGTPGEIAQIVNDTWDEEETGWQIEKETDYLVHRGGIEDLPGKIREAVVESIVAEYSKGI